MLATPTCNLSVISIQTLLKMISKLFPVSSSSLSKTLWVLIKPSNFELHFFCVLLLLQLNSGYFQDLPSLYILYPLFQSLLLKYLVSIVSPLIIFFQSSFFFYHILTRGSDILKCLSTHHYCSLNFP